MNKPSRISHANLFKHPIIRLEIIGRFPTDEEATQYEMSYATPVWLSTKADTAHISTDILQRIKFLREELS